MFKGFSSQAPITLIIVDCQYDFYHPSGSLYVSGAEKVIPCIEQFIRNTENIKQVIFTKDWHLPKHCSFKAQGGVWNAHCIAYSAGSQISPNLIDVCIEKNINYVVVKKGELINREEYGAFYRATLQKNNHWLLETLTDKVLCSNNPMVVMGIAGDYCVLETLKNLCKTSIPISVLRSGVASIDGGVALKSFMEENNIPAI